MCWPLLSWLLLIFSTEAERSPEPGQCLWDTMCSISFDLTVSSKGPCVGKLALPVVLAVDGMLLVGYNWFFPPSLSCYEIFSYINSYHKRLGQESCLWLDFQPSKLWIQQTPFSLVRCPASGILWQQHIIEGKKPFHTVVLHSHQLPHVVIFSVINQLVDCRPWTNAISITRRWLHKSWFLWHTQKDSNSAYLR